MRNPGMKKFLSWLLMCLCVPVAGQTELTWNMLGQVEIQYCQDEQNNLWIMVPRFDESLHALNGKSVQIRGYALPVSATSKDYVLSAFPFASCFFCGGAGPESVIELRLKKQRSFRTDEWVILEGTLVLCKESNSFLYRLENARPTH